MEETVRFMDYEIPISVFQKKEEIIEIIDEDIEEYSLTPPTGSLTNNDNLLDALCGTDDIVRHLLRVSSDEFLTNLMFTYVRMKTNASIREKAKKFNIPENLLFAAYYKIFLPALKYGKGSVSEAYEKVQKETKISDKVIKSISAAKSNHKKHAKKVITDLKFKYGILNLVP